MTRCRIILLIFFAIPGVILVSGSSSEEMGSFEGSSEEEWDSEEWDCADEWSQGKCQRSKQRGKCNRFMVVKNCLETCGYCEGCRDVANAKTCNRIRKQDKCE